MSITIDLTYAVDLAQPLTKTLLPHAFFTGDEQAHRFRIALRQGGEAVSLTGYEVAGYFIRPDGATVSITGSAADGYAQLLLPAACYHQPGRFSLVIRLTQEDARVTVFWAEGAMSRASTDTLVDDGVIPSLDELLAQISAMEEATEAASTVAQTVQTKLDNGELHGKGLTILGYYATLSALTAAVTAPQAGDAYAIGTAAPYDTYIWNGTGSNWVNNGVLQGVPGEQGAPGTPGADGADAARNLLDNGDFRHAVNQRGLSSYNGTGSKVYTIDRWCTWSNVTSAVVPGTNGITVATGAEIIQYVPLNILESGKGYTFCACKADGTLELVNVLYGGSKEGTSISAAWEGNSGVGFALTIKAGTWRWAALYEGTYTQATLPSYIPKGDAAEYAVCRRYYVSPVGRFSPIAITAADRARLTVILAAPMRIAPTAVLLNGDNIILNVSGTQKVLAVTSAAVNSMEGAAVYIDLGCTAESTILYAAGSTYLTSIALSADL